MRAATAVPLGALVDSPVHLQYTKHPTLAKPASAPWQLTATAFLSTKINNEEFRTCLKQALKAVRSLGSAEHQHPPLAQPTSAPWPLTAAASLINQISNEHNFEYVLDLEYTQLPTLAQPTSAPGLLTASLIY